MNPMNYSGRMLYPQQGFLPQAPAQVQVPLPSRGESNGSASPRSLSPKSGLRNPTSPKNDRRVSFAGVSGTKHYHVEPEPPELLTQESLRKLNPISVEEAIFEAGVGRTQYKLLLICGLTFCSDAAEVTFLSYVTEVLRCDWGLTSYQESIITSAVFAGMALGSPIWGWISDHHGRRMAFLLSSLIITAFGFATAFSQGFYSLVIMRALVGVGVSGLPVGFDILAEALPSESRGAFLMYIEYFWTLGSIYVNLAAWGMLERYGWRVFTAMAALPTLVASLAGIWLLPESPRWLVDMDRSDEAAKIIQKWAKDNGEDSGPLKLRKVDNHTEDVSVFDLCRRSALRWKTFAHGMVWFSFGVSYYGVVMLLPRIFNKTGDESEALASACSVGFNFQDLAIASLCEILGVMIAVCTIDSPGRVPTQGFAYILTGICSFMLGFRYLGETFLIIVASIGRFGAMLASCATWVQCPELFPTTVRGEAHSLMNLMSKLGAFLAPFIISDIFTQVQCGSMMCAISLLAAGFAFSLPETAGEELSAASEVAETVYADSDLSELSSQE
ncbi:Synaptic vesicle 2-related protein (SV2-related protein) [Durusdinium trenchii]|uniref:Synaptic vesicle 2-related protein (SV2-related protein) n=1 Tax=Durusdinium trenchii TaxID=1381693 RepID=A0ABP0RSN3_9DINO